MTVVVVEPGAAGWRPVFLFPDESLSMLPLTNRELLVIARALSAQVLVDLENDAPIEAGENASILRDILYSMESREPAPDPDGN